MPQVPSGVTACRAKTFGPDCVFAAGRGIPIAVPAKRIKAVEAVSVNFITISESESAAGVTKVVVCTYVNRYPREYGDLYC